MRMATLDTRRKAYDNFFAENYKDGYIGRAVDLADDAMADLDRRTARAKDYIHEQELRRIAERLMPVVILDGPWAGWDRPVPSARSPFGPVGTVAIPGIAPQSQGTLAAAQYNQVRKAMNDLDNAIASRSLRDSMNAAPTSPPVGGGGGPLGVPRCFAAGTRVAMADGSERAIEDVRVGELALSYDERTGAVAPARVAETFAHEAASEAMVVVNGELRATAGHPIFADGRWRPAGELRLGDSLVGLRASIRVSGLESAPGTEPVYNLEVEGTHTYFAEGILVHNKMGAEPISPLN
jgi:hypothetical protein